MTAYELHVEAEEELYAAAAYYEDRVAGLGHDFLSEFDAAVAEVVSNPLQCALWPDLLATLGVRRKLLPRFPYGLPYLSVDDRVVVLAVAHLSRAPGYWLDRRGRED